MVTETGLHGLRVQTPALDDAPWQEPENTTLLVSLREERSAAPQQPK